MTDKSSAKQRVGAVDVRRRNDEHRTRPRIKCKPPRSIYLNRDDLTSAVAAPSGIVQGETLVKMTESQLLTLRRQASYRHSCTQCLLQMWWNECDTWSLVIATMLTPSCTAHWPLVVVPPFCLCSSLVHSLPHLLLFFIFSLFPFLIRFPIFFYCPSLPFLPESSHSDSRSEVVGGDQTWV